MSFKIKDTIWGLFSATGNPGYYLLFKSLLNEDTNNIEEDIERR